MLFKSKYKYNKFEFKIMYLLIKIYEKYMTT